jgi:hypothetical protein
MRREDVAAFIERFENGFKKQASGKKGIDVALLQDIVREAGPDMVALAVNGYLEIGSSTKQRAYYQRAYVLAVVHQLQSKDDSLVQVVFERANRDGFRDIEPERWAPPSAPEPHGYHFRIDQSMLTSGDVYPIVRFLSFERATGSKVSELAALRGRCLITFDLPDDGHYVWEDARVRKVVKGLFDATPYFPYFLSPKPELQLVQMFYLCLADPSAFKDGYIELSHDTVISRAVVSIMRMNDVCEKTGENHVTVVRETFAAWPTEMVDDMLRLAAEVQEKNPR